MSATAKVGTLKKVQNKPFGFVKTNEGDVFVPFVENFKNNDIVVVFAEFSRKGEKSNVIFHLEDNMIFEDDIPENKPFIYNGDFHNYEEISINGEIYKVIPDYVSRVNTHYINGYYTERCHKGDIIVKLPQKATKYNYIGEDYVLIDNNTWDRDSQYYILGEKVSEKVAREAAEKAAADKAAAEKAAKIIEEENLLKEIAAKYSINILDDFKAAKMVSPKEAENLLKNYDEDEDYVFIIGEYSENSPEYFYKPGYFPETHEFFFSFEERFISFFKDIEERNLDDKLQDYLDKNAI